MEKKIYYRCNFCNVEDTDKEKMEIHEQECCYNPVNKACVSCEHYSKERLGNDLNGFQGKRSICTLGFTISSFANKRNRRELRRGCEFFVKRLEPGEPDIYDTYNNKQNPQKPTLQGR